MESTKEITRQPSIESKGNAGTPPPSYKDSISSRKRSFQNVPPIDSNGNIGNPPAPYSITLLMGDKRYIEPTNGNHIDNQFIQDFTSQTKNKSSLVIAFSYDCAFNTQTSNIETKVVTEKLVPLIQNITGLGFNTIRAEQDPSKWNTNKKFIETHENILLYIDPKKITPLVLGKVVGNLIKHKIISNTGPLSEVMLQLEQLQISHYQSLQTGSLYKKEGYSSYISEYEAGKNEALYGIKKEEPSKYNPIQQEAKQHSPKLSKKEEPKKEDTKNTRGSSFLRFWKRKDNDHKKEGHKKY